MLENPISHSGGSRAFLIRPFRFTKPPSEADYVFFKRVLWLHAHQPGAQGRWRISTVIKVSSTSRRLVTLCSISPAGIETTGLHKFLRSLASTTVIRRVVRSQQANAEYGKLQLASPSASAPTSHAPRTRHSGLDKPFDQKRSAAQCCPPIESNPAQQPFLEFSPAIPTVAPHHTSALQRCAACIPQGSRATFSAHVTISRVAATGYQYSISMVDVSDSGRVTAPVFTVGPKQ
jgi:hypothetical protein